MGGMWYNTVQYRKQIANISYEQTNQLMGGDDAFQSPTRVSLELWRWIQLPFNTFYENRSLVYGMKD